MVSQPHCNCIHSHSSGFTTYHRLDVEFVLLHLRAVNDIFVPLGNNSGDAKTLLPSKRNINGHFCYSPEFLNMFWWYSIDSTLYEMTQWRPPWWPMGSCSTKPHAFTRKWLFYSCPVLRHLNMKGLNSLKTVGTLTLKRTIRVGLLWACCSLQRSNHRRTFPMGSFLLKHNPTEITEALESTLGFSGTGLVSHNVATVYVDYLSASTGWLSRQRWHHHGGLLLVIYITWPLQGKRFLCQPLNSGRRKQTVWLLPCERLARAGGRIFPV